MHKSWNSFLYGTVFLNQTADHQARQRFEERLKLSLNISFFNHKI
jgi:hypothetical protein